MSMIMCRCFTELLFTNVKTFGLDDSLCWQGSNIVVNKYQDIERRGSVMVSTSTLHDRVLSSRPGPGMGMFGVKTWLSTLGDCVSLVNGMITLMSVPSHLIGDVKEPLRMTCTLAVTTLIASI